MNPANYSPASARQFSGSKLRSCLVGAILLAAILTACTSTHMQSNRTPAGMAAPPFRNVMVVGVDVRPEVRRAFENDVVGFLRAREVAGTASNSRFSLDQLKGNKEQVRDRLLAAGAQSVLVVRVTDRTDFVKGASPSLGSLDLGAVDESRFNAFTQPGGEVDTAFGFGIRLYRVSDGSLIWSALAKTVMKEDSDSAVFLRKVAKAIVDQMAKDKVIP